MLPHEMTRSLFIRQVVTGSLCGLTFHWGHHRGPIPIATVSCHSLTMTFTQSKLTAQRQKSAPADASKAGPHTSEEIHQALFARPPKPRSTSKLKEGIRRHMRKLRARG